MQVDLRSAKGVCDFLRAFKFRADVYVGVFMVHIVLPPEEVDQAHFLFNATNVMPMGVDLKLDGTLPWWKNRICKVKLVHSSR